MFWMNMLHSEKTNWAAYAPGGSNIPDNVKSITIDSPTKLTFTLTQGFNTYWYTYNQLSQITPLPAGLDIDHDSAAHRVRVAARTAPTASRRAVRSGLHVPVQAGRLRPDKPQGGQQLAGHLRHQPPVAGGRRPVAPDPVQRDRRRLTMAPNPTYSGPVKPTIEKFKEVPVHLGHGGVQRPGRREGDIRLPAAAGRHRGDQHTQGGGQEQPPPAGELQPEPAERLGDQLLPLQLQLDGDSGKPGPSSASCTSARPCSCLVDQPATITKSGPRLRRARPTGRSGRSRRTPSPRASRSRTPTRTT